MISIVCLEALLERALQSERYVTTHSHGVYFYTFFGSLC